MVQEDGEFARDGDDGALLAALAAGRGVLQSPTSQIGVRSSEAEDVLRAVDQQLAQVAIAGLRDAQLRRALAGLSLPRDKPR